MNQIKSRQRVVDHGEVYTSEKEVNAMLNLIGNEIKRSDSRFLEPACGTGNFLIEILKRKMSIVFNKHRTRTECETDLVVVIGSLYGIDLLEDNVQECRKHLFDAFKEQYRKFYKVHKTNKFEKVIQFILSKNIVCGNALTMSYKNNSSPIIFSEWSSTSECYIKRRDFSFMDIVGASRNDQTSIFDDGWLSSKKKARFTPVTIKEYSEEHYTNLISNEQ